jgi:hypothetical protein
MNLDIEIIHVSFYVLFLVYLFKNDTSHHCEMERLKMACPNILHPNDKHNHAAAIMMRFIEDAVVIRNLNVTNRQCNVGRAVNLLNCEKCVLFTDITIPTVCYWYNKDNPYHGSPIDGVCNFRDVNGNKLTTITTTQGYTFKNILYYPLIIDHVEIYGYPPENCIVDGVLFRDRRLQFLDTSLQKAIVICDD